jgi:hypothetical protein
MIGSYDLYIGDLKQSWVCILLHSFGLFCWSQVMELWGTVLVNCVGIRRKRSFKSFRQFIFHDKSNFTRRHYERSQKVDSTVKNIIFARLWPRPILSSCVRPLNAFVQL